MAEQNTLFNRLKRLFRSNIVVRKTPDNRLVVKDVDFSQMGLSTNFIDRYTKLVGGGGWGTKYAAQQNAKNAYEVARTELFRDYELMDSDPLFHPLWIFIRMNLPLTILKEKFLQLELIMLKFIKFYIIYFMIY